MSKVRRVAVLAGSSIGWREKLMRGIAGYSNEHGRWHVYTAPEGTEASLFFSESYSWDGLIVRVTDAAEARRIVKLGVPAASVGSARVPSMSLPRVKVDDAALTGLAARHLITAGIRQFGYCSWFPRDAEDRGPAFAVHLAGRQYPCDFYSDFTRLAFSAPWQARQRDLAKWIRKLPKPVGILTWNPDVACQVVEACNLAHISVPQDVAIITADDDPMKCELSNPTISAIEIPAARIGYEAAALLDRMMSGVRSPGEPVLIEPAGIVTVRQSSNTSSLPDRDVHLAVQFIREHASESIGMHEVARHLAVSRRWLERHFQRVLGHSPHEELQRCRLELAKKMLLESDMDAGRVAAATGFGSASYFTTFFRRFTGLTPIQFRTRHRLERRRRHVRE
ncbi:MAG TPA: DNA-binding transcriptional regulator [Tepidisphaeraceae bacterium]|nr:DNA-binding transcriptional regulator [Tepidisphaeraceae bacterium]